MAAPEAEEVQRGWCVRGHQSVLLLLLCSRLLALPGARVPGPNNVPVLHQRRLRGRRGQRVLTSLCSVVCWHEGACAADCMAELVVLSSCARPDPALYRIWTRQPQGRCWLGLDELSP